MFIDLEKDPQNKTKDGKTEGKPATLPKETYRESGLKINDSVETSAVQLLSIIKNPSEEVVEYLKNKTEKVKARVVKMEKEADTQTFDRNVKGEEYVENVTFDTVTVEIEGLSSKSPIKINATIFEALTKIK